MPLAGPTIAPNGSYEIRGDGYSVEDFTFDSTVSNYKLFLLAHHDQSTHNSFYTFDRIAIASLPDESVDFALVDVFPFSEARLFFAR